MNWWNSQPSELAVVDEDWAQSRRAIDFLSDDMRFIILEPQQVEELLFDSSLSPKNSLAITQVLGFLKNQHDVILKRVGDTEGNIGFIGTSELWGGKVNHQCSKTLFKEYFLFLYSDI